MTGGGEGRRIRDLLPDIRRAARESPSAIASRQRARLSRLIGFARERSAFYRDRYARLPAEIRDIRELPPVAKSDLMAHFDAWVTDPAATRDAAEAFAGDPALIGRLFLDRHVAFATSGTTGRPAIFLHDRDAVAVYLALAAARLLPSLLRAGSVGPFLAARGRTATIVATGGHFTSSVIESLARGRFPGISGRNRLYSLLSPLPALVAALNDFRPAVVGSYPTALSVLAGEQAAGRLRIRPALALSGAERLTPAARQRIAEAFRCPVAEAYAASEFPGIAFDCRLGRLHLNADWAILEPVDAGFRPAPPGTPSFSTLLTNLANGVQPLIRYDLGDSVTVDPAACPCGSRLPVIRVEGRTAEILPLETPDGEVRELLPLVLSTVIEEAPGIRSYQLVRRGRRSLSLRIEEAPHFDRRRVCEDAVRRLREYLSRQGLGTVAVDACDERPRRDPAGGKLLQVLGGPEGR
ncbi:MAG: phenylacetate--CoA ligase family protein [Gemmatimonadota bacterium]